MTRYDGRWFIVISVFLFVLALGYVVDYVNPFGTFREQRQNRLNAVVLDGAEIVIHYLHGDGTVAKTDVLSASEELIGLSRADVGRIHPGWMIVGFSSDRMIVNKFCPEPAGKEGFLQVVDGHVGIFKGEIDGCHQFVEKTTLAAGELSEGAQRTLREGIEYRYEDDIPQLLDGLKDAT